jgi:hypothetical protein
MNSTPELASSSPTNRPVIFLDIDGVLNRSTTGEKRHVDSDLLARFEQLVSATNARVVLTSTWRHDPEGLAAARRLNIPFDDVLPDLRPRSRANEVDAWLASHPEAKRFLIIDDEDDDYDRYPLFQPPSSEGLTPKLARGIEAYLKGERESDMRRNIIARACQAIRFAIFGHKG